MKRRRVLIGGRMGTGKSTVARMLGALGGYVISSDDIGHQVQEPGSEVADQIMKRWPDVTKDGRIDRQRLAAIVFSDRAVARSRGSDARSYPWRDSGSRQPARREFRRG